MYPSISGRCSSQNNLVPLSTRFFILMFLAAFWLNAQNAEPGKRRFDAMCAGCHGAGGTGGERGPALVGREGARVHTVAELRDIISNGIPAAGMPPFKLAAARLDDLAAYVHGLHAPAVDTPAPGDAAAGEQFFFADGHCSGCHAVRGRGGWIGPDLSNLGARLSITEIETALKDPSRRITPGFRVADIHLRDGSTLRGLLKNESTFDLQLQGLDGKLHLLDRDAIGSIDLEKNSLMPPAQIDAPQYHNLLAYLSRLAGGAPVHAEEAPPLPGAVAFSQLVDPNPGDWPTYHGVLTGNRHSALGQINAANVASLGPRWNFTLGNSRKLEMTPVVVDGVMYVTSVNEAYALDARSGRTIWHFERPRSKGLVGDAAGGINRGVAILGDRVFIVTDNAHLLALHRLTGSLLWDVEMADSHVNYGSTSAPLVVHDLVISGTSGGDEGIRGFVSAYKASTGERVWRFFTVPAPGEPLAETWKGKAIIHACSTGWLTGTYDSETNLLFWPTGNP